MKKQYKMANHRYKIGTRIKQTFTDLNSIYRDKVFVIVGYDGFYQAVAEEATKNARYGGMWGYHNPINLLESEIIPLSTSISNKTKRKLKKYFNITI